MEKLAAKNRARVLDLLSERLAFERNGVRLYDTVLTRLRDDTRMTRFVEELEHIRDEELAHAAWLDEQIRALGGDARMPTEHAILVQTESEGIERVVRRDPNVTHDLHAILSAELSDNAGWDLLVQLADGVGDHAAKKEFKKRLHAEEKHLVVVREAVLALTKDEVLTAPPPPEG
jgi:bacterioferritin (cytochrome b1)